MCLLCANRANRANRANSLLWKWVESCVALLYPAKGAQETFLPKAVALGPLREGRMDVPSQW